MNANHRLSMLLTVITNSRSAGIGNGLTYESDDPSILPGCLVEVSLRQQVVEGMVIATHTEAERTTFDIKKVTRVLSPEPILSPAQLKTLLWMAQYYRIPLRKALQVFLPAPPWKNLLPEAQNRYTVVAGPGPVRGKKQAVVMDDVRGRESALEEEIIADTGASKAILRALVKGGHLTMDSVRPSTSKQRDEAFEPPVLPALSDDQHRAYAQLREEQKPCLLFESARQDGAPLIAQLVSDTLVSGKSALLLTPDIFSATEQHLRMGEMVDPQRCILLHGNFTPSQRRRAFQQIRGLKRCIVIGTRTAVFAPIAELGLIVIDREHAPAYKSEQSPRYHARHVAEVLAMQHRCRLVLISRTPSLESWNHATSAQKRYALVRTAQTRPVQRIAPRIIDLTQVQFGTAYPFSPELLLALDDRWKKGEQSVLLLNRRGSGTALLCLECRRHITSATSALPMTVHTVRGVPQLIDHYSGHMEPVPTNCPSCGSTRLFAVGAGTQRMESLLQQFFPTARVQRVDGETLDAPADLRTMLDAAARGETDILIGTQPVVRALSLPRVTLCAVVLADVGLSLPDFRAGERVFQLLTDVVDLSQKNAHIRDIIIQTFRPMSTEIQCAARGDVEQELTLELLLRTQSGYPPASQLIALIVRGAGAGMRAKALAMQAQKRSPKGIIVSCAPSLYDAAIWRVFLRGLNPRTALEHLDLSNVIIDVDPIDIL